MIYVRGALAEITAINADALLAEHLKVEPGQAVLLLSETLFTEELTPIEFSRGYSLPGSSDFHILRRSCASPCTQVLASAETL